MIRSVAFGLATLSCLAAVAPGVASAQTAPAQPGTQPAAGGLSAGGLAPPRSMPATNAPLPSTTEADLDKAEKEDSGRGLEFVWLNAEIGWETLGLQTFRAKNLVDAGLVKESQSGLVFGGGLGLRIIFITAGARFRLGHFDAWDLWTLNAELGLRIPVGSVEPYFTFGGGYASAGSFDSGNIGSGINTSGVDITGYDLRGGGGIDFYLSDAFSIGASVTGEVLFLTRPGVDPQKLAASGSASANPDQAAVEAHAKDVYAADGSSIGSGLTLSAVVGLHF